MASVNGRFGGVAKHGSSLHTCFSNTAALGTTMTYIGITENKIKTTIMGYIGFIGYILGLYWDNGKENGNH